MSQLILVQRNLSQAEIAWIRETHDPGSTKIYVENNLSISELNDFKVEAYFLDDSVKTRLNTEVLEKVIDFGSLASDSKFSVAQRFQYQQMNIWYYNRFRIYYKVRDAWYQISKVEDLLRTDEDSITIFSSSDYLGVFEDNDRVSLRVHAVKQKLSFSVKFSYLLRSVLRVFLNIFLAHNPINKFLVISPSERVQPMLSQQLEPYQDDPIFGYLLKKYGRELIILNENNVPLPGQKVKSTPLIPRHHKYFVLGESVMVRALLNFGLRSEWKIVSAKFKRVLENINRIETNPMNKAIIKAMTGFVSSHNYYIYRYLAYRNYFKRRKIRAILATDENSMFVKSVLDAAKQADILTVGMQHGNIHPLHPAYRFSKADLELHPTSDYTMVWGKRWKQTLLEYGNYPENELEVVGQLRTDIIPKLKTQQESQKESLVFASQPQPDPELRRKAAADVFRLAMELEIPLRVKLHPRETDPEYYEAIANEEGLSKLEFTGKEDLYEVINKASLVITCYSTVGAETAYFHKPLIILDYLKEDINDYARDGIAFQASDFSELKLLTQQVVRGDLKIEDQVYERYIRECAYKLDGKVSNRIMDWLRTLHPITSHNVE